MHVVLFIKYTNMAKVVSSAILLITFLQEST